MKELERIFIFLHPPAHDSYRCLMKTNIAIEERWEKLVIEKSGNEKNIICVIHPEKKDKRFEVVAMKYFGNRYIIDPYDDSPETMILLAQDIERTLKERGRDEEWVPNEIASSNEARKWTEGLKKEIKKRGYLFDPERVKIEWFGSWSGCNHKYPMFMGKYLGLSQPIEVHAETELCPLVDFPMKVHQFVERIPLDHYVQLYLFKREDGAPMAQFFDGLREIWEFPHIATVSIDPQKVELFTWTSLSYVQVNGASKILEDGFIADVGDGCRPAFTTVVGWRPTYITSAEKWKMEKIDFDEFRTALVTAKISDLDNRCRIMNRVEV